MVADAAATGPVDGAAGAGAAEDGEADAVTGKETVAAAESTGADAEAASGGRAPPLAVAIDVSASTSRRTERCTTA
jgi:hypothetical protein